MTIVVHDYESCLEAQKEKDAELDEAKGHMAWALKMLYDQEKGNPVFEEMCDKYIRGK